MSDEEAPVVALERWSGPWPDDDPDANLKADVAAHGLLDPLRTLEGMSRTTGIPVGALVRYVLAKWATAGSAGLLELGPSALDQLWAPVAAAEAADDDRQRLAAYHELRQRLSWLRFPLEHPGVYPEQA